MSVQIAVQGVTTKPPPMLDQQSQERLAALRDQARSLRSRLADLQALHRSQGTNDAVTMVRASVQAERERLALPGRGVESGPPQQRQPQAEPLGQLRRRAERQADLLALEAEGGLVGPGEPADEPQGVPWPGHRLDPGAAPVQPVCALR